MTGARERGLHTGSAADSRTGVWAWRCQDFLLLCLTNLVCCHPLWLYEKSHLASVCAYFQVLTLGS